MPGGPHRHRSLGARSSAVGKADVAGESGDLMWARADRAASFPPMRRTPRPPTHGQLVVLLGALSTFGPLSMDMYLPGLPAMARDLSAPAWAAQLTITTSMLGLAGGQLVAGPISDALGRRRPLLVGLAAYMATSLLCAMAPNVWALLVLRLGQGCAGAAGIVIARAVVRDLHTGVAAARFFAMLMLVA